MTKAGNSHRMIMNNLPPGFFFFALIRGSGLVWMDMVAQIPDSLRALVLELMNFQAFKQWHFIYPDIGDR